MAQSLPQRKSPRLKGYDYSLAGAYFVTVCSYQRRYLFGYIQNRIMILNDLGHVVEAQLMNLPNHWNGVDLDLFVVMPNHIHAIIIIVEHSQTDAQKRVPTLGKIVGNFKAGVTRIASLQGLLVDDADSGKIWQGRYHDHIIRDERSMNQIQEYVANNPSRWEQDTFFSAP